MSTFNYERDDYEIGIKAQGVLDQALKITGKQLDPKVLAEIIESLQKEKLEKTLKSMLVDSSHQVLSRVLQTVNDRISKPVSKPERDTSNISTPEVSGEPGTENSVSSKSKASKKVR